MANQPEASKSWPDWNERDGVWVTHTVADRPVPTVFVTDNPIVAQLLGSDGKPISQVRERPPIGFRS